MSEALDIIVISSIIGILLGIVVCIPVFLNKNKEDEFCKKHREVYIGMYKEDVIDLMGENYTISYLKNNIEKLEWRYRHSGYTGRVAKGVYAHSSSFTRKISVFIQDGKVVEVKSLNMD